MKEDGGPAFPLSLEIADMLAKKGNPGDKFYITGMSLRDWFAGQAIQWYSNPSQWSSDPELVALYAYKLADAMLKERERV